MPDVLVVSAWIPRALGAKVILDLHDPMPELVTSIFGVGEWSIGGRLTKRLEKWSIAHADLVVTVNAACERIFTGRSCPPEKIDIVMNSPDEDLFPFRRPRRQHKGRLGSTTPFVVMYHGTLVERNGLDLAVSAFALVREAVPAAELRIYGRKTPFLETVMCDVRARGLQACVRYLGPRALEDLAPEIEQCDVGVIPNHRNAFSEINTPTRIFEYLASGKLAIVPRTPGIQDYFDPESLLFFEAGNADDLAQRMLFAACNPDAVAGIVERGQEVYLRHRWSREKETLVNRLRGLLTEPEWQ